MMHLCLHQEPEIPALGPNSKRSRSRRRDPNKTGKEGMIRTPKTSLITLVSPTSFNLKAKMLLVPALLTHKLPHKSSIRRTREGRKCLNPVIRRRRLSQEEWAALRKSQ